MRRADRLFQIVQLLRDGKVRTASWLARELEVSERTIYRDLDALSAAGVPVYAERGPGGGCALLESYRTNLTGLTEGEVRALFMLSIPAPLAALGVDRELKAALRKLAAALPDAQRRDEERVRQRIHLDANPWFQTDEPVPHLQAIQQALWQDRRLQLTYDLQFGARIERLVEPLGLVAKAGAWLLVCAHRGRRHIYQVSRVVVAQITDQEFDRPAEFDLIAFWRDWSAGHEAARPNYPVRARVSPALVPLLPRYFGNRIQLELDGACPADGGGWITLTLPFATLEAARERILGFGRAIEVLAPTALRASVIDFAMQIQTFYRG